MVVGGLLITAARRLRADVENATGRSFAAGYRSFAEAHGPVRVDEQFTPYPGIAFDDTTYTGDAYPCFGWAADRYGVSWQVGTADRELAGS